MPAGHPQYKLGTTETHYTVLTPDGRELAAYPKQTPLQAARDPVNALELAVQTVKLCNERAYGHSVDAQLN